MRRSTLTESREKVIDAHAHVVAPEVFYAYKARLSATGGHHKGSANISDAELAAAADRNIALMDQVGTDIQLISPRPYQLMTSAKPAKVVHWWIEANNDLIARTVAMRPTRFAAIGAIPAAAGRPIEETFDEIDRLVELGFVGVLLNPDPSEGAGDTPPLGDEYWYPLFERLQKHDLPALIHSAGCYNDRETYSEHFITEESVTILSILRSPVFQNFPDLKLLIAHGGGSVPYQIGRWQAERLAPHLGGAAGAERFEHSLRRFYFDSVLHYPPALAYLIDTVGSDRVLFGTERPGSGSVRDPETGLELDNLKAVIDANPALTTEDRSAILGGNARKVFTRLNV